MEDASMVAERHFHAIGGALRERFPEQAIKFSV
jgi:hypothetical protein